MATTNADAVVSSRWHYLHVKREQHMETTKEKILTRYRVFTETGVSADHEILMEKKPVYDELLRLIEPHVGGASLMHVRVLCPDLNAWTDMFIDDMGALKKLPRNDAATKIYRNSFLSKHPDDDPEKFPYIAGPAVVFLRPIWEGWAAIDRNEGAKSGRSAAQRFDGQRYTACELAAEQADIIICSLRHGASIIGRQRFDEVDRGHITLATRAKSRAKSIVLISRQLTSLSVNIAVGLSLLSAGQHVPSMS
jgi:hypothetical protein